MTIAKLAALFAAASMVAIAPAALADGSPNKKNFGQHQNFGHKNKNGNFNNNNNNKNNNFHHGNFRRGKKQNNGFHGFHGNKGHGNGHDDDRDDDRGDDRDDDGKKGKYGHGDD